MHRGSVRALRRQNASSSDVVLHVRDETGPHGVAGAPSAQARRRGCRRTSDVGRRDCSDRIKTAMRCVVGVHHSLFAVWRSETSVCVCVCTRPCVFGSSIRSKRFSVTVKRRVRLMLYTGVRRITGCGSPAPRATRPRARTGHRRTAQTAVRTRATHRQRATVARHNSDTTLRLTRNGARAGDSRLERRAHGRSSPRLHASLRMASMEPWSCPSVGPFHLWRKQMYTRLESRVLLAQRTL